jgi:hypothetical protein
VGGDTKNISGCEMNHRRSEEETEETEEGSFKAK